MTLNKFTIAQAREHYKLVKVQEIHQKVIAEYKQALAEDEHDIEPSVCIDGKTIKTQFDTAFKKQDLKFQQQFQNYLEKYNKIVSQKQYNAELEDMKNDENLRIQNHQESTLLHRAVEMGLVGFTKFLLSCGLNPNFAEGSGITPLLLAILRLSAKSNSRIVETLIDAKASTDGSLYATLPDPLDLAKHIGNPGIIAAIEKARERKSIIVQRLADLDSRTCQAPPTIQPLEDTDKKPIMQRSGFVVPVVGDVGTCKTNAGAMKR